MLQKLLSTGRWSANATDWASLILRITLGCLMLHHGIPKLNKMLSGDMGFADPIGIGEPASLVLTVFAEFLCSILIVIGLGTRFALIPLIITMLVAVFIVHAPDSMDKKEHGLMFLLPYCALFLLGAGKFSIDAYLKKGE
jgi:putative oxidoreductase